MTDKELQRLSRRELLEILIEQSKEVVQLQAQVKDLTEKVEDKNIRVAKAGSIAEASLQINNLFGDAQAAADQYIQSIKNSETSARIMLEQAEKRALEILEEAKNNARIIEDEAKQNAADAVQKAEEAEKRAAEAEMIITEAEKKAADIEENARKASEAYWNEVRIKLEDFCSRHEGLGKLIGLE